ncbi:shikimate dehydrogenase [Lysobacter sp. D1-1-M9]|uniref:shikimate dehydrogenase n=1 Tax=Novilysobacter longmucuonensis TaxID=3098603 RepID=UPI002FC80585
MSIPRFAVIGHPVAHSLSPRIHTAFGRQLGIALEYGTIDAAPEQFESALASFAAAGGTGANITLPHKARAASVCEHLSDRARRAGAVNTLLRTDAGWEGDNTDGVGLVRDLTQRHGLDLRGRRSLLIGAGGAAAGVAPALLDAGLADLFIVNRSRGRTDALAAALGDRARVHPHHWDDLGGLGGFDLVIHATSAAHGGAAPSLPGGLLAPRGAAVDLGYGAAATGFLDWARASGAGSAIDGLGMLVEQAAESFLRWHGARPDTAGVYAMLRERDAAPVTGD